MAGDHCNLFSIICCVAEFVSDVVIVHYEGLGRENYATVVSSPTVRVMVEVNRAEDSTRDFGHHAKLGGSV